MVKIYFSFSKKEKNLKNNNVKSETLFCALYLMFRTKISNIKVSKTR